MACLNVLHLSLYTRKSLNAQPLKGQLAPREATLLCTAEGVINGVGWPVS